MPKLKEACIGSTNEEVKSQLADIKAAMKELEEKIEKFKSSGAKLITEKELN